jgi:hypothetical protein
MELAYEADHVFTNLLCLSDHEMQVPVVVKLGHDCLQIASVSKVAHSAGLRGPIRAGDGAIVAGVLKLMFVVAEAGPHT